MLQNFAIVTVNSCNCANVVVVDVVVVVTVLWCYHLDNGDP